MSEEEVTKEQIESLAEKLDVFMASLPDREREHHGPGARERERR